MKDVIHHLKYVQKKVIQSNRKAETSEKSVNSQIPSQTVTKEASQKAEKVKHHSKNQLRQSRIRLQLH